MIPQSVRYEKFQGYFLLLIKSTHIALFDSVSLNQNQCYYNIQSEDRKIPSRAHENYRQKQPNCLKRGKTRATKLWLVSVLHLIGGESFATFLNQSVLSKAKPIQSRITFDTQRKIGLKTSENHQW